MGSLEGDGRTLSRSLGVLEAARVGGARSSCRGSSSPESAASPSSVHLQLSQDCAGTFTAPKSTDTFALHPSGGPSSGVLPFSRTSSLTPVLPFDYLCRLAVTAIMFTDLTLPGQPNSFASQLPSLARYSPHPLAEPETLHRPSYLPEPLPTLTQAPERLLRWLSKRTRPGALTFVLHSSIFTP